MDNHILAFYLHNGFSGSVEGNEKTVDALKDLLVPNPLVKGIAIYTSKRPRTKITQLNYTKLKELRNA